jgi:hypothetical protein
MQGDDQGGSVMLQDKVRERVEAQSDQVLEGRHVHGIA